MKEIKNALLLFSKILEYPTQNLKEDVEQCAQNLKSYGSSNVRYLQKFSNNIQQIPFSKLEELYTQHIDFNPSSSLYVGYHLFGDSYKRSKFLVQLRTIYKQSNFVEKGAELPDCLTVILQYFGEHSYDSEDSRLIIKESLIPSLKKIHGVFEHAKNIYCDVIQALLNLFIKMDQEHPIAIAKGGSIHE